MPLVRRTAPLAVSLLATALAVGACSGADSSGTSDGAGQSSPDSSGPSSAAPGSAGSTGSTPGAGSTPASSGAPTPTSSYPAATSTQQATSCASRVVQRMTPAQRAGQLIMVGLQSGHPASSVTTPIGEHHVGSMLFLGGWQGTSGIRSAAGAARAASTTAATRGVQPLIAADQEGGAVWQVRQPGINREPSALALGRGTQSERRAAAERIAKLLTTAGVNTNLAPVADTVPTSVGTRNQPIGRHERQFGSDPQVVSRAVVDTVRGLHQGGVATTLKHFPGLGRVTGNTDFTAQGTSDAQATMQDPYLQPFRAGIKAGSDLVMVSSAVYPKIDGANQALFSHRIVTDLLRKQLKFGGIVITDDVNAKALQAVPVADRAVRFVQAGGDIVLTGRAADAGPMASALSAKAAKDPTFRALVDAAATRVVAVKAGRGLVDCG